MKLRFKQLAIPFLACLFVVSSCKEDLGGDGIVSTVDVRFRALMNGQPLQMNERYMYNGKEISFTNLRFFLSDLVLVKGTLEAGSQEIDLVNFTTNNTSPTAADNGITISNASIPSGTYDGLKFGIGVPSDLNAQSPADFSANHPLSNDYWDTWNSYIFHKIEGRYDGDANPADLESSFVYHIGLDQYFREKTFSNLDIVVRENESTAIVIDIELMDILKNEDGSPFNFAAIGNIHSEESLGTYTNLIANNWLGAFSL